MDHRLARLAVCVLLLGSSAIAAAAPPAFQIRIVQRKLDPHGSPRPAKDSLHVPIRTSLYFEIETPQDQTDDGVDADSVTVSLQAEGGEPVELLRPGRQFVGGSSGWLKPRQGTQGADYRSVRHLAVYLEPGEPLQPETRYSVRVSAKTKLGAGLPESAGTWQFQTESTTTPPVEARVDFSAPPTRWHGRFFSGLCNVTFCTSSEVVGPTYELMNRARQDHPRAWSYQRDFWMTGMEHRPPNFGMGSLPNIVREKETRRIAKIEESSDGLLLHVEDFFGHEQYGIPSGRPVSDDYRPGDEILISDGVSSARAKVLAADSAAATVLVSAVPTPEQGWKIDYEAELPTEENPDAPGLFASGGCYLRKFSPHGTACYYWGRLDKEFDLIHRVGGRRLMVNFADAAGDLSLDGRNWTTAKDLPQWHATVRDITGHLIDRYGEKSLDFTWSVFNEPDLGSHFWRAADWNELQRFYDYTVDGILRAFEDRGYDSEKVFVGGLELGGIFGTNLRVREFLAHCSPRGEAKGMLPKNAAFADPRLDGKRSRRVEALCRAHDGKGSPCDFISIHAYNASEMTATKLIRAKEIALEIDSEYFADLWVNSHESCPEWNPPPDEAAEDSYLGNGYFSTWCVDVAGRQLRKAASDPRYGYGETLLTVWPPQRNFGGLNAITRIVHVDDDGDGQGDRMVTIPNQVFHALTLLSDLGNDYQVLPEQFIGGHLVAGFASRDDDGTVRVLVYAHHGQDTQSRSDKTFAVALDLRGLDWKEPPRVTEYRFDRTHNSYFDEATALAARKAARDETDDAILLEVVNGLESDDPGAQLAAISQLETLPLASMQSAIQPLFRLFSRTKDQSVRAAVEKLFRAQVSSGGATEAFPVADVARIEELAKLRPTREGTLPAPQEGTLRMTVNVAGNGLNFVVIEPPGRAP